MNAVLPAVSSEVAANGSLTFVEAAAGLILLACLSLGCADVVIGPWDHDGGFYLQQASYLSQGYRPYVDFTYIYTPLVDVIHALILLFPIGRLVLAVVLPMGWIAANTFATIALARAITGDRAAAMFLGALFPLFSIQNGGNHVTLEHGVALFSTLAITVMFGPSSMTPKRLFVVGVLFAAACLSKQNGVVTILPIGAIAWARRDELTKLGLLAFFAGASVLPFLLLCWIGFNVAAMYRSLVTKLAYYAEVSESGGSWIAEWLRAPESATIYAGALIAAVLAFLLYRRWRALVISAVAGAILGFLPRLLRNYPHYNINMWPFLVLALALGAAVLMTKHRSATVLVLGSAAAVFSLGVAQSMQWYPPALGYFQTVAHAVSRVTPPDARVRQYGSQPIIEFLSYRNEEMIETPDIVMTQWDGSGLYKTPPSPSTTVVLLNEGQPWLPKVQQQMEALGFAVYADFGRAKVLRYRRR